VSRDCLPNTMVSQKRAPLAIALCLANLWAVGAQSFLEPNGKLRSAVDESLLEQLSINASAPAIELVKRELQDTYLALPKESDGHLGHLAVRYMLHRYFVKKHGWFIRGLEPNRVASKTLGNDWVPSYLQESLEKRAGQSGISLHELAILVVTLESLIGDEAVDRFQALNESLFHLPNAVSVNLFTKVMRNYMVVFLKNEDSARIRTSSPNILEMFLRNFVQTYKAWPEHLKFIDDILKKEAILNENEEVQVDKNIHIFPAMGLQYSAFNDPSCRNLKHTLLAMEGPKGGRVRLTDFYNMSLYSHWAFDEKPEYLRRIGALDESRAMQSQVIITNYVQSMSNCLNNSKIYSICCRNECEELMAHLEHHVGAPEGDAKQILDLVSSLASDTVTAPRELPLSLSRRLMEIATTNQGKVPLHGRLFAQWMHHAYPRECPYPYTIGSINPQSPEEWMHVTGESSRWESADEIKAFLLNSTCSARGDCHTRDMQDDFLDTDLPWNSDEELPLVTIIPEYLKSSSQASEDEPPSLALQTIAKIMFFVFSSWHVVSSGKVHASMPKIFQVLCILLLTAIVDPFIIAVTIAIGIAASTVLPYLQKKEAQQSMEESKLAPCNF